MTRAILLSMALILVGVFLQIKSSLANEAEFLIVYDNSSPLSEKVAEFVNQISKASSSAEIDYRLIPYSLHQLAPNINAKLLESVASRDLRSVIKSRETSVVQLSFKDALTTLNLVLPWRVEQVGPKKLFILIVGDTWVGTEKTDSYYQEESRIRGLKKALEKEIEEQEARGFKIQVFWIETESVPELLPLQQMSLLSALQSSTAQSFLQLQWLDDSGSRKSVYGEDMSLADEFVSYVTNPRFFELRRAQIVEARERYRQESEREKFYEKPKEILRQSNQPQTHSANLDQLEEFLPRTLESPLVFPFRYTIISKPEGPVLEISRDYHVLDFEMIKLLPEDLVQRLSLGRDISSISQQLERERAHQDINYWRQALSGLEQRSEIRLEEQNKGGSFKLIAEFKPSVSPQMLQYEIERLTLNGKIFDLDAVYRGLAGSFSGSFVRAEEVQAMRVNDWQNRLGLMARPDNSLDLGVDYVARSGNSLVFNLGENYLELEVSYRESRIDPLLIKKLGSSWLRSRTDASWAQVQKAFEEERFNDANSGSSFFFKILQDAGFYPTKTDFNFKDRSIKFRFKANKPIEELQSVLANYSLHHSIRDLQAVYMLAQKWKSAQSEKQRENILGEIKQRFALRSALQY